MPRADVDIALAQFDQEPTPLVNVASFGDQAVANLGSVDAIKANTFIENILLGAGID